MRKKLLLTVLACAVVMPIFAVKHEKYITESVGNLYSYYSSWTPGSAIPGAEEDENFFIGRQRPLVRFTNTESDPIASETKRNQRKLMWWVPINQTNSDGWRSLPAYCFNSEVFNMWSYIDIYGNWTQPFLRNPGAFTDVCHKNGVATEVVSTAAWGVSLSSTDGGHGQNYSALASGGADKLMKMFRYYGIDGLGFNSEQTWGMRSDMKTLFTNCHSKRSTYNVPLLHFGMYNLSSALYTSGSGTEFSDFFPYANAFFLNYNWGSGTLSTAASNANSMASSAGLSSYVNSYDVYAGMDMQGGTAGFHWTYINNNAVSVGIWGAHNMNMLYEGSTTDGSTGKLIQNCYLRRCEQFFTGGTRNPVNSLSISDGKCSPSANFFGVNKLVAAKSSLSWNTNSYFPFITYFNLGNGEFFNVEGKTTYDNEWYNIGIQDFLPTWRWWITTAWRGRNTSQVPSDTHAAFTWDDAWFGGSCMKITFDEAVTGSNARFIHLFKTDFPLTNSDTWKLRIRYKVLSGSAVGFFAMSATGTETTAVTASIGTMSGATWQVKEVAVPSGMVGKTMAMLGLQFRNIAAGTEILVGEMALYKEGVTYTPICPTLAQTKILKVTSKGVDFKTTWNSHIDGTSTAVASDETCHTSGSSTITYQNPVVRNTSVCTMSGSMTNGGRRLSSINVKRGYTTVLSATTIQTSNYASIYTDKTGTTINVTAGTQYTLNATYSGQWMQGALFIDLNNDGDFTDSGELMSYDTTNDGTFQTAYTFTVPSSATNGTYTLRFVVLWYDNVSEIPAASCGQSSMAQNGGSITDFTINVTGGSGTGLPIETVTEGTSEGSPAVYHPSGRNAWEPVYNDEVGTWYFEVWGQQCGEEPHLITCTTSWAAYGVEAPINIDGTLSYRVGVRAVAPDGVTKSDIQWSSYLVASNITILEGYSVDKPVIKANETFTVSFDDPQHGAATYWKLIDASTGSYVSGGQFDNCKSFTTSLATEGIYDVEVKYVDGNGNTVTEIKRAMIQVSSDEVGAYPQVYTLDANKEEVGSNEAVTLDYTGRYADGTTSRGLRLSELPFCVSAAQIYNAGTINWTSNEITYSLWFNPYQWINTSGFDNVCVDDYAGANHFGDGGIQMLNIRCPSDSWAKSDWGYLWSNVHNDGINFCVSVRKDNNSPNYTTRTDNFVFVPGIWYHLAVSITGTSASNKLVRLFINGRLVTDAIQGQATVNVMDNEDFIYFGGPAYYRSGFDGAIDEFQIWKKAFTASTIGEAMRHYEPSEVPNDLVAYWDFESDHTDKLVMMSKGKFQNDSVYAVVGKTWKNADGIGDGSTLGSSPMVRANREIPQYVAGTPYLEGVYPITTTASWKFDGNYTRGATTDNITGTPQQMVGSTNVSWETMEDAPYTATITLENPWGKDSKSVLIYDARTKLDEAGNIVEKTAVYPNPFAEEIYVRFVEDGDYVMQVYSMSGQLIENKPMKVGKNEIVRMSVNGGTGMYVIRLLKDGKNIEAFKIEKK